MIWRSVFQVLFCSPVLLYGIYSETEGRADICDSPLIHRMRDSQISASTEFDQTHNASAARFNSDGWIASKTDQYQHLDLDLEDIWEITKIDVQGSTKGWFTRTFRVSYSDNGYVWTPYNTRLSTDPLGELFNRQGAITFVNLTPPVKARYIAINPVSFFGRPSLRIEFYGCKHSPVPTVQETNVPSTIDVDTTWIPSQSPIIINRLVVIRPTVTLIVQAGVSVIFTTKDAGIDVWGTLVTKGITGLYVLLSSNKPVLAANSKWKGVVQRTGGNVTMENTIVRQAVTGIQGNGSRLMLAESYIYSCLQGIRMSGGSIHNTSSVDTITDLEHMNLFRVSVHDNVDGIVAHGTFSEPNIYIGHSVFDRNKESGIIITNWDFSEQDATTNLFIFNTSFSRNLFGIKSGMPTLNRFYISYASFIRNMETGFHFYRWSWSSDLLTVYVNISKSKFIENNNYGIRAELFCYECESSPLHNLSLTNNLFSHETHAIKIDYTIRQTTAEASIRIDSNEFVSNVVDVDLFYSLNGRLQIATENNSFSHSRFPLKIVSEDIKDNSASVLGNSFTDCLTKSSGDEAIKIKGITAHISNNTFQNCSLSSMIVFLDGTGHTFAFNSLINTNVSMCYLNIEQEYEENSPLIVDNNYWGTTNMEFIKSRICDFFLDSTKAIAKLDRFFHNVQMENASSSIKVDDFRSVKDAENNVTFIGGIIHHSFDFSAVGDDNLILDRSLLILYNAHVNISGVNITIMQNRGIKVYGSLTIGDRYDPTRNALLKLKGAISWRNKWTGISMHSSDLAVYNLEIEGADKFVEVNGNGSAIVLYNCSSTNNEIQHLINANVFGGNFSLLIENSTIATMSTLVRVKYTSVNLDITVLNSNLQSKAGVLDARESDLQENITHVNLYITSSSLSSTENSWYWLIHLEGCGTHFTSTITTSTFSAAKSYDGLCYMKYSSVDLTAVGNTFGDTRDALNFEFCGDPPSNFSKVINITGNVFNSFVHGSFVLINKAKAQKQNHKFYIANNTFDGRDMSSRIGISCSSFSKISRHTLYIYSNDFTNIKESAIYAKCGSRMMIIRNNSFINNRRCISVHGSNIFEPIESFEIFGNTFLNNSDPDGIIYLDRTEYGHQIANITENMFKENTGTAIALTCPEIRLNRNYFDNQEALYNVKVLPGQFPEQTSIDASLNYWGTTNVREIIKGIYDYYYDKTLLHVDFRPYLGSQNISDIQNTEVSFLSENGEAGGNVNGNVELLSTDSPYLVVSNIKVNENDTLTLEAGVELRIKSGVGIYVQGALHIRGRKELPVKMIPESTGQPWRGLDFNSNLDSVLSYIYLNDTLEGLVLRGSSVSIQNVTSTHSRQSGITVNFEDGRKEAVYNFIDAILENNLEDGILVSGDHNREANVVTISSCRLARNKENGISVRSNARIEIINCSIAENEGGIDLYQNRGGILYINDSLLTSNIKYAIEGVLSKGIFIDSCNIRNHTFGYFRYSRWYTREYIKLSKMNWYDKDAYAIFRNTHFQDNTADWIKISCNYGDHDLNIVFENNVFSGGKRTLFCKLCAYNSNNKVHTSVLFINNTLQGHSIKDVFTESALIEISIDAKAFYNIEMFGNRFYENSARACLAISSHHDDINNGEISVLENSFKDNNVSLSVISIQGQMSPQIHRNIFRSKFSNNCTISAPEFHMSILINATHNYWGTHIARNVVETVCGFEKDMNNAIIWTFPFYEYENLTSLVYAMHQIGGEIETDTYITQADWTSPIKVYRSIIVREGAGLYLQSGVVLQFAENRGIYVQGTLVMFGGDSNVVLEGDVFDSVWYGIVINSTSYNSKDKVQIQKTSLQNTLHGIVAYTPNFEIKRSHIINSASNCLTLFPASGMTNYDFEFTTFEACGSQGINSSGAGSTSFMNAHIINTSNGISVDSTNSEDDVIINIFKNVFENVTESALSVHFSAKSLAQNTTSMALRVEQNKFNNSCMILIQTWNNVETTFRDNEMSSADCSKDNDCFMQVFANGNGALASNSQFDISANRFENIHDKCIIGLKDNDKTTLHGSFVYNTLQDNKATDGVVLANARYFNISRNIFDNPVSVFDVITELKGSGSINVTNNWWGRSEQDHVYTRITDQRRVPNLIMFEVEPVLFDLFVDCSEANNCSSHGRCISPNHCSCTSGWTGHSCMQNDCSGVNNCYGNGVCIGPNECSCREGWSGAQCLIALCSNVSNCSGHGFCVEPNICACAARFTGNNCNSCVPLHGGPYCQPCPECQHGTCSRETGLCECEDVNWTGYLCDECSETFYGSNCLPLMKVLEVLPSSGPELGGGEVHVWGHNFKETLNKSYTCRFGNKESEGKWLAWNHVVCIAPRHPEGEVILRLSPDGSEYINDQLVYFFYSTCPPSSCGRDYSPSRGQCVFGTCSCLLPWTGVNCTIELIRPIIAIVDSHQTAKESEIYTIPLQLKQGELPVRWYVAKGPIGMTVNEETGLVTWAHTLAYSRPYQIDVRASNVVGEDSMTWSLIVPASYTVYIENIEPGGVLPAPRPVTVFGRVTFLEEHTRLPVPVQVIISSTRSGRQTFLNTVTDADTPDTFMAIYYPRPNDAGLFIAQHTQVYHLYQMQQISLGLFLECKPSTATVDLTILQNYDAVVVSNISTLYNVGNTPIYDITGEVDGLSDAYIRRAGDSLSSNVFLEHLDTNDNESFDLFISNAKPLHGTINIIFTTKQGTSTGMKVHIRLSVLKPLLSLEPPLLRENIVRGTIRVIDVNITNTGDVSANEVSVSLPNDPRLSLVSFTSESNGFTESTGNIFIQPQEAAHLSISIVAGDTEPLGEMTGTIYINSKLASSPLPYAFFFTSVRKFNVTFTVKDEYTYFASGSPLVSNAIVRLSNPRRGLEETRYTTNETGYVVFEDVYEDKYSLYAEAEGHSSSGAVIVVTPGTTEQDIFLQRVAVKYTWTVEPTTVEDVYKIELNSTFETYVPMPVVTIEPAHVDTLPLVMEGNSSIEFTITNHGLIRADNVRFSLPTTHPYLIFVSEVDFIGNLAANTSVIVPVNTTLRNRAKRSAGSACVDILLLYNFRCSGVQTRSAFVRLTHGQSGRSCIYSFVGRLYGGNIGGGYFIGYSSTTSISCDCVKTFIKSCVLAFIPGFGCPLAANGIISLIDKGRDGMNLKDGVLGILDVLVGCFSKEAVGSVPNKILLDLLKRNLPILEHMYTAVRCVMDMEAACSKGRKRREVSSEVINAVVMATRPMENFINIGIEILGNMSVPLETTWYNEFKKSAGDNTALGALLSSNESFRILNTVTEGMSKNYLNSFLERYNNTAAAWDNGSLSQLEDTGRVIGLRRLKPMFQQFLKDMEKSIARGYGSIFDEYEKAVKSYDKAEQQNALSGSKEKEGVCARVRIRIMQELVLTRDAFKARLEIENGESSDLENIKVEIQIKQTFGSSDLLNDKFSVGKPTLIGISSVDGNGRLERDLSGSAEWLIIPYSNAAPEDDTRYDIGGRLSYSVDGSEFSTTLLPDTITVKPNPSLLVHYFHEKYVRGDDALTPQIEPIIPFTLAVMVTNEGYGVARALKITSGQPEIIENEKGLLITFKIISAQLGSTLIAPSLTVNFGDIKSFETKTGRWLMTSTLMGTFYNYSASFENINPLGDPQLSLLDTVGYHELFHLVRIQFPDDDDVDDFLVNDMPDQEGIPEKLYNSANGTDVFDVHNVNVSDVQIHSFVSSSSKVYKQVNLTLFTNTSVWFYTRIINTFTSSDSLTTEELLSAVTHEGRAILLDKNVWQTNHIFDTFFLHLFDYVDAESSPDSQDYTRIVYTLIYGPRNRFAPKFNSTSYNVTVSDRAEISFEVVRVNAYDIDKDNLEFKLKNESITQFRIRQVTPTSVAVIVDELLTFHGPVTFELIVVDDGVPSRSSAVSIYISIGNGDVGGNTTELNVATTRATTGYNMRSSVDFEHTSTKSSTLTGSKQTTSNTGKDSNSTWFGDVDTSSDIPLWIIPVCIVCFLLLILVAVIVVCVVRKRANLLRRNDNSFELK